MIGWSIIQAWLLHVTIPEELWLMVTLVQERTRVCFWHQWVQHQSKVSKYRYWHTGWMLVLLTWSLLSRHSHQLLMPFFLVFSPWIPSLRLFLLVCLGIHWQGLWIQENKNVQCKYEVGNYKYHYLKKLIIEQ